MNELAIITTSAMQGYNQLREANRLKYRNAYYEPDPNLNKWEFNLGAYLVNYCLKPDEWEDGIEPDWVSSFLNRQRAFTPEERRDEELGFFGLPHQVVEGLLIYIQELFYDNPDGSFEFYELSNELMYASSYIVRMLASQSSEAAAITDEEELSQALDDEILYWEERVYGWNWGEWLLFFDSDEEITLFCQLAAYMGHSVHLYPMAWSDMEIAPVDVLLEGMAMWEKKKGIQMVFEGKCLDHTDTVLAINSEQSVLTGNTYLAEYMEKIFNQSPWHHWLKALMEDFKEYFPLRKEKIRVDAYAAIKR